MTAWLDFVRRMSIAFILALAIGILFVGVLKVSVSDERLSLERQ
ncbi:hypothetical protein [Shouchella lonarensis]|uniref:Uncharacterized protein n=1 Tax=Shouchella lonarensis TaxID=1464122 RepID=A0A1G6LEP6_9BACI|nr:hypothetical protein [Shouchella lonarensis]SDC41709.1 hypothetical protein SAMN05421737_108102 [Shouchella lonarensis]